MTALSDLSDLSGLSESALVDPVLAHSGLALSGPSVFVPSVSANVAAHLAALADRCGWSSRPAFLEAHRIWTHGEGPRPCRARRHRAGGGAGWVPVTGC
ncbi:hypothetical protein SSOG_00321 [Streptomyces himastatinicus ATCC 53653]|uniref:Uncharacterized protein n=1 Tax=Streptomyces himastatinicus ATCC 53653 TaxID=457427 RepID=D9W9C1_9ACTN|nr:hypothetical protein SSOG_00321 [Streptomyces himastatinicus ATCC 53653]